MPSALLQISGTTNQPAGISFAVIVNVRAEKPRVNSQKVVQSGEMHFRNWEIADGLLYAKHRY
jgi:hypothetical protein